jgi:predicted RNase H-like HicB family nuclease
MVLFPAIFEPQPEGGFTVTFPDLPGCITEGDTEAEATNMALDALQGFIEVLQMDKDDIPSPSSFDEIKKSAPINSIIVMLPVLFNDVRHKRINITLGESLIERIDLISKREGFTRSGFLAVAAREYLDKVSRAS